MFILKLDRFDLHSAFSFFFFSSKSLFFVRGFFGFFVFRLSSFFFFSKHLNNISFFFFTKYFFRSFLSHFFSVYNRLYSLFFFRLKLRGLGYRIKRLANNLFRFFIGTTNFFFFHVPLNVLVKARRRRIFFLSSDLFVMRSIFVSLLFLKRLIPYKLRGVFFPRQIILMKPGKKRF